jgi:cytochrome c oxidase cbb3-type subunit 3
MTPAEGWRRLSPCKWRLACLLFVLAVLLIGGLAAWRHARDGDLLRSDPDKALADPALRESAVAIARPVFAGRCAGCHGDAGQGVQALGTPDLTDGDWLYGTGAPGEIEYTIRFGIRAGGRHSWNLAAMPAYATLRPYADEPIPPLTPAEIEDVTQFVLGLSGRVENAAAAGRGAILYQGKGGCFDCHGASAEGDPSIGAPNLRDGIWLFGGNKAAIHASIARGRAGVMPAFDPLLSPLETRSLAIFLAARARNPNPDKAP